MGIVESDGTGGPTLTPEVLAQKLFELEGRVAVWAAACDIAPHLGRDTRALIRDHLGEARSELRRARMLLPQPIYQETPIGVVLGGTIVALRGWLRVCRCDSDKLREEVLAAWQAAGGFGPGAEISRLEDVGAALARAGTCLARVIDRYLSSPGGAEGGG